MAIDSGQVGGDFYLLKVGGKSIDGLGKEADELAKWLVATAEQNAAALGDGGDTVSQQVTETIGSANRDVVKVMALLSGLVANKGGTVTGVGNVFQSGNDAATTAASTGHKH